MRLQLVSGVILNTDNESLIQQYLKYGAVEYKEPVEAIVEEAPKTEDVVEEAPKTTRTRKKAVK
uniref:Uncharacterized protein n=1 Tax=Siphoviridae sp. ctwDi18 TaxID=2827970 RepID=A0A8S5T997_9CAUD|nr:MAG TPA: hypothetical protein [Siphoviridae sp. ctwDi18]